LELDEIVCVLGKPECRGKNWAIYHGDCLSILEHMPKGSIPLTVTSPPYNIGKPYEKKLEVDEYVNWCSTWIRLIYQATTDNGGFWLNLGYIPLSGRAKALPIPYLLWDKIPFFLVQEIVWNYGAGVASRKSFSPRNEKFLWYVKNPTNYTFNLDDVRDPDVKYPNQKKNGKLKCNPLGKNPTDVWKIAKVTSGENRSSQERTLHPCQFPIAVVQRIVRACSRPGDVILDPFIGSGSLGEAAIRCGRKAIGFEINRDYIDIVQERLRAIDSQLILL